MKTTALSRCYIRKFDKFPSLFFFCLWSANSGYQILLSGLGTVEESVRGCFDATPGLDGCLTGDEYIQVALIGEDIIGVTLTGYGTACFCTESFCNAELSIPGNCRERCEDGGGVVHYEQISYWLLCFTI